jgi:hypothetical protein
MNSESAERLLGEYRLKDLLQETEVSRTWLAEQISVSRLVLIDELRADKESHREAFLADVRAKAAVDHPLIGSVYEAVAEPGRCFYAHELLPGTTLADSGATWAPVRLAHILRRIAEANLQHEALGHASTLLGTDAVHVDEHGVIRLKNLAVAGTRDASQSVRDVVHLGTQWAALIAAGHPGATRLLTLFGWMRGENLEAPLSWAQVRDYCLQIEHQLADPLSLLTPGRASRAGRKKQPVGLIVAATLVALIAIAAVALKARPPAPPPPPRLPLPADVTISAGNHLTPDGAKELLPAFQIGAAEVTIGQYASFLETIEILAANQRERTFDLPDQPAEKTSHVPDDWAALHAAAKSNGVWRNLPVTLDSPVVGVDWWDASAYAEWKKSRLATQEEWFAALTSSDTVASTLAAGSWQPVTSPTPDRTANGLIGMAGSVCEWTAKPAANPANPLGEKLWVLIGGSYLKAGSNALTREWTANRSLRRPDLGFRIVSDVDSTRQND